jgi:hypothetical protein
MRRLTALLTILVVGPLCAACLGHSTVRVTVPGTPNDVGEGAAHIRTGQPVSVGSMSLCLSRAGRATIDDVSLVGPVGGIEVDGWTLVNHPKQATEMFVGTDRRTLRSYGYPLTHTVDMTCPGSPDVQSLDELVVQVERTDDRDAGSHAFRIDWTSNDDHGSLVFPLAIALCQERSSDAAPCRALHVL